MERWDIPEKPVAKPPVKHTLLNTVDPKVWAMEFCRVFHGWRITSDEYSPVLDKTLDVDAVAAWFDSAMSVARQSVTGPDTLD